MTIKGRLHRLETALACRDEPGERTWEQWMNGHMAIRAWLKERGYADHLAALEAGETGPEGLEDLLREQASYDPGRRAFDRIMKALAAGTSPDEADLRLNAERIKSAKGGKP